MSAPIYTTLIPSFFSEVLQPVLTNYIYNGYNALAGHLRLPLGAAAVLSITLLGIAISQGWIKLSMDNFVKLATKIGLIYLFAMNWSIFSHLVVNGIQGTASEISDWLVQANPISLPDIPGSGNGIQGALQSVLIELTDVGFWIWKTGHLFHPSPWVAALLIWGFGFAMLLVGIYEIVIAQLLLAVLLTLAPVFILFTLFKPTQPFFDRWLGMVAGNGFLLIFISATLALTLNFAQWVLGNLYQNHATGVTMVDFVPVMLVGFIGVGIILKVAQIAHAIGGGVSIGSSGALLAGTVGGFIGGSVAAGKTVHAGKKLLDKVGMTGQ